jgi:hypothetical protein
MKTPLFVFAFAIATVFLWGHTELDLPVPDPEVNPERAYFPMQRSPRSVMGETGFLTRSAIDDFVDVAGWQDMDFDKGFFFVGGGGGSASAAFRGGGALRIGGNYLGLYFSGDVFSGRGSAADKDSPSFAEAVNQSYDEVVVNDNFIALFGNALLGGLRFDLRFDQAKFTSLTAKNGDEESSAAPFVTTLQWGRRFGAFVPRLSAGVSWGGRNTDSETDHPKLALKAEAAYGAFAADYHLSVAFDKTATVPGEEGATQKVTLDGGVDHLANFYFIVQTHLTETLALSARPGLEFEFYGCENKAESSAGTAHNGELSYFAFAPSLEAALRWRIAPNIGVATGVRFDLLRLESKTRKKGDDWTDDTGDSWSVAGLTATGGSLAFEFSPSEHFTLEAGVDGLFDFAASEYKADLTKLSGGFACVFRL